MVWQNSSSAIDLYWNVNLAELILIHFDQKSNKSASYVFWRVTVTVTNLLHGFSWPKRWDFAVFIIFMILDQLKILKQFKNYKNLSKKLISKIDHGHGSNFHKVIYTKILIFRCSNGFKIYFWRWHVSIQVWYDIFEWDCERSLNWQSKNR